MPLCIIFTKCPEPAGPIHSQQGVPSGAFAAILCKIGLTSGQAATEPPGIMEAPFKAPSSPPDTPLPTKRKPFDSANVTRRFVSSKFELPPSIKISPGESKGKSCSISSSTALPARTIIIILRGKAIELTKSAISVNPSIFKPLARPLIKRSTTPSSTPGTVRLYTETFHPLLAMFKAKFSPITANPISPTSVLFCIDIIVIFIYLLVYSYNTHKKNLFVYLQKKCYFCSK